jgi:selenocysteine lyase/cysteine desulfurase
MKNSIVIACSVIESMMHGVAYFKFKGNQATAVYTDGTEETAPIPEDVKEAVQAYYRYQNENGPECDCPNTFSIVSAIQDNRKATA